MNSAIVTLEQRRSEMAIVCDAAARQNPILSPVSTVRCTCTERHLRERKREKQTRGLHFNEAPADQLLYLFLLSLSLCTRAPFPDCRPFLLPSLFTVPPQPPATTFARSPRINKALFPLLARLSLSFPCFFAPLLLIPFAKTARTRFNS